MREILFKAKRVDNWEWVEGFYLLIGDEAYIVCDAETDCVDGENADLYATEWYEVLPETVCQYTGLTDKNGKKIFEGDILSGQRYHDSGQGGEYKHDKCTIKWNEKHAAFAPIYYWESYNHDLKDYEVIGNAFDNPELLEVAE